MFINLLSFPDFMESQLIFLGTGGDAHLVGKSIRGAGGIILRSEDLQFHIDPGPGALVAARHYDVNIRETSGRSAGSRHPVSSAGFKSTPIGAQFWNGHGAWKYCSRPRIFEPRSLTT